MRKFVFLLVLCLAFVGTQALAAVVLTQDWESGAGTWYDVGIGGTIVNDAIAQKLGAGNHALKAATETGAGTKRVNFSETDKNWTVTWDFYQDKGTNYREYMQLGADVGGLQELMAFGTYNATPADQTYYQFRIAFGGIGWANTTVARVDGDWVSMKVEQIYKAGDPKATVNFYVNNVLAASSTTTKVYGITYLTAGSNLASTNKIPAYFDNIVVTSGAVPEQGSMLALGTGLVGLLGIIRRKRA